MLQYVPTHADQTLSDQQSFTRHIAVYTLVESMIMLAGLGIGSLIGFNGIVLATMTIVVIVGTAIYHRSSSPRTSAHGVTLAALALGIALGQLGDLSASIRFASASAAIVLLTQTFTHLYSKGKVGKEAALPMIAILIFLGILGLKAFSVDYIVAFLIAGVYLYITAMYWQHRIDAGNYTLDNAVDTAGGSPVVFLKILFYGLERMAGGYPQEPTLDDK